MYSELDKLLKINPVSRIIYGYDKNDKPNDYCNWIEYIGLSGNIISYWEENDWHFRQRIKEMIVNGY